MSYILAILASYFVAYTIALMDGPFGLCAKFREWVDPEGKQDTWLRRGVNCPICIGCYTSFCMAWLLSAASLPAFVLTWLSVAGGVMVVHLLLFKERLA